MSVSFEHYQRLLRRNLSLGIIRAFVFSIMFYLPIWFEFETWYLSAAALGTLYSMSHLMTVVLEMPTGALADLIGRKKTMILGSFLYVIGFLFIASQQASWMLWVGYLINAVANALYSGSDVALYYDSLVELDREDEFAQFQARKSLLFRMGLVIATFLGARVYALNPRLPYYLYSSFVFFAGILTFFFTEPKIDSEKFTWSNYIWQTKQGIKELTRTPYIKDFTWYYLGVGALSWYFIYFLGQPLAIDFGLDATARGNVFAVIYLVMALVNYWLSSKPNLKREVVYSLFISLLLLGFLPAVWVGRNVGIILLFLLQLAGSLRFSLLDQYANQEFRSQFRATAVSTLNMGVSLVFAILSLSLSWIVEQYSASTLATILGIVTLFIVTPTWWVLLHKHNGVGNSGQKSRAIAN